MLKEDFVAASANVENPDPGVGDYPVARQRIDNAGLHTVMSNSFGFGGTNACCAALRRVKRAVLLKRWATNCHFL